MPLSNREFYQLHGILTEERVQHLLDIEDLANNAMDNLVEDTREMQLDDYKALHNVLYRAPLQ